MAAIPELVVKLQRAKKVFWQGGASENAIAQLEKLLEVRLPLSFQHFLRDYGGGGVIGQEISGIEDGKASIDNRGTVYGDTLMCRKEFGLPVHHAVIYFTDDDALLSLDTSAFIGHECPVVFFNTVTKAARPAFPTFEKFLEDYLLRQTT